MCSSRIDHESGVVTITTPGAGVSVGQRFYVPGSAATFGIRYSDWVLRLLDPLPPWKGRTSGTPNHSSPRSDCSSSFAAARSTSPSSRSPASSPRKAAPVRLSAA
jgi:hypothetical protein